MIDVVGMEIEEAEKLFKKRNIPYKIEEYDDFRLKSFDKELVLRVCEADNGYVITTSKFLFDVKGN